MSKEPAQEENFFNEDLSEFKSNPSDLFKKANSYFNEKKFEEGIYILEQAIKFAIELYGDENDIRVAKFLVKYANGIIRKLNENEEILNIQENDLEKNNNNDEEEDQKVEDDNNKEDKKEVDNNNNNNINQNKEKIKTEEQYSDEEYVYANLKQALEIYQNYLSQYDSIEPEKLEKNVLDYYNELCDCYSSFADLEQEKSDFKHANEYYEKAIFYEKKYGKKFSRNLASLYFLQSQVLDFNPNKCFLCLLRAKYIMEFHLKNEIEKLNNKNNLNIFFDEKILSKDDVKIDDEIIFKNKNVIESEEMKDLCKINDDVAEYVAIINDLTPKIEDVILELKEYDTYLKEKNKMKIESEKVNKFEDVDLNKIQEISPSILKRKKKRDENIENTNDELNNNKNNNNNNDK